MEDRETENPNQYQEEWFEIAEDLGSEFQLPNISGIPPTISNMSINLSKWRQRCRIQTRKPGVPVNHLAADTTLKNSVRLSDSAVKDKENDDMKEEKKEKQVLVESISSSSNNGGCRGRSLMDIENGEESQHGTNKSYNTAESADHKCLICDAKFTSGAALGGHMSSHSRKRKMESLKKNQNLNPCSTGDSMAVKVEQSYGSMEKKGIEEGIHSSESGNKKRLTSSLENDRTSSLTLEDAKI